MSTTDRKQAEVVQRLFDLVNDIRVVERTLLRFEKESEATPEFSSMTPRQQLSRLIELLLEEKRSVMEPAVQS